jgi:hypothetical protein
MALPPLNWRLVGLRMIPNLGTGSGTLAQTLDTIYQLGISVTYADGTLRVPGTGSAWTWARDGSGATCVAAYGVPPTVTALAMRYIFAGNLVTTTYTPLSPDTATAGNLLVGMNKNSGAYAGWATAAPFTTGNFSGFWRMAQAFAGAYSVAMWESQEACVVQVTTSAGTNYAAQVGALFDPLTYTSGVTCETDNRVYYMCTTGSVVDSAFLSLTTASAQAFGNTPGTGATGRSGYFVPGTGNIGYVFRGGTWTPSTTFVSPSGRVAMVPFWSQNAAGQFLGAARNFYMTRDYASQLEWRTLTGVVGYAFGANVYSSADTVVLGY